MANELVGANSFIVDLLSADPELTALVGDRIFRGPAPDVDPETQEEPVYPMVLFHLQSAAYSIAAGGRKNLASLLYCVKAVGESSDEEALQPIADRIDALLTRPGPAQVAVNGVTYAIAGGVPGPQGPYQYDEVQNGRSYLHLGAFYRIFVQS